MEKKTFAFKLAERQSVGKWKARDGVSLAGCTEIPNGNYRDNIYGNGHPAPQDGGLFC
jgi:hypothetical protein